MKLSLSLSLVEMKRQYLASTRAPKAILTLLASIFRLCITVKKKKGLSAGSGSERYLPESLLAT